MMFEENRRQTYANAIRRVKGYTFSQRFLNANSIELNERLELLRDNFSNFTDEHLSMVSRMSETEFQMEDEHFAKMEKLFRKLVIHFRKRIVRKEAEECAKRVEQYSFLFDADSPRQANNMESRTGSVIVSQPATERADCHP